MQVAHVNEDRALNTHLARTDRFAELDELSFAELLSLEDDLSAGSQWSLLDDVKAELAERRDDAATALRAAFIAQAKVGGEVPMVDGGKVITWPMHRYLVETIGAGLGSMTADVLLGATTRERLFAAIAAEYAEMQSEDLLNAGWSAQ